jgi:hypothetical protein
MRAAGRPTSDASGRTRRDENRATPMKRTMTPPPMASSRGTMSTPEANMP